VLVETGGSLVLDRLAAVSTRSRAPPGCWSPQLNSVEAPETGAADTTNLRVRPAT
jgi:hypothetical protein